MRKFCLLFFLLCFFAIIKSQVPADAIVPEDAAYANRSIPTVTGKLLNISADELKKLPISYTLVTPFSEFQVKKTVSAQPDGSFRFSGLASNIDYEVYAEHEGARSDTKTLSGFDSRRQVSMTLKVKGK